MGGRANRLTRKAASSSEAVEGSVRLWAETYRVRELERLLQRYPWTAQERSLIQGYSRRLVRRVLATVRKYRLIDKVTADRQTFTRGQGLDLRG